MATATTLEYHRPWIYPKQEAAIFPDVRWAIVEASTKSGKTVGCMVWLFEQAMGGELGWNYWWVAPVYRQAKIAYRRFKRGLPREVYKANDTELTLTLPNGTVIWFLSAEKPDNLYGEDVRAAVLDEASRMREESWYAVRSTLSATEGSARIIGNVKGKKNWAYRMARRAESGEPGMSYSKLTAYDAIEAGILSEYEVEEARRDLPAQVFDELYMAIPSDDGGNPFGMAAIESCIRPLSTLPPVCWGWDLAKHIDWTVGIALDKNGDVCRFHRFQKPWEETIEFILKETKTKARVDATGVGDPIVELLQKRGGSRFEGFTFTSTSKQQIMEGLAVGVQEEAVGFPDGVIRYEMDSFEYTYTRTGVRYSAPEGLHDDCVCGLALAWSAWKRPRGDIRAIKSVPSRIGRKGGDW